jgi:sensor domain CHASE-containing protein
MSVPGKVVSLTVLILALAAFVWGLGYFWNSDQDAAIQEKASVENQSLIRSASTKLIIEHGTGTPGELFVESQEQGF